MLLPFHRLPIVLALSAAAAYPVTVYATRLPDVFDGTRLELGTSFSWAQAMLIDGQAILDIGDGALVQLTGSLSNKEGSAQGVSKLGNGTLSLEGMNTYAGNTEVHQGTLRVAGHHALGSSFRTLELHAGTQLELAPGARILNTVHMHATPTAAAATFADIDAQAVRLYVGTGSATLGGALMGDPLLIKQGAGTLHLNFWALAPVMARVDQGALEVNSSFGGPVWVAQNAKLAGRGSVSQAILAAGATLAPGPVDAAPGTAGALGELTITGNLELQPGSTLSVDTLADGRADHVRVLGLATLAGTVHAHALPGDWSPETRYTVVSARGGVQGVFQQATSSLPFLQPQLDYDDQHAYLTLIRNDTPLDSVLDDPGDNDVGDAVDALEQGPAATVRNEVLTLPAAQAATALNQLAGRWAASTLTRLLEDSRYIRQTALHHATSPPGASRTRVWGAGYGAYAHRDATGPTRADSRELGGLAMGVRFPLNRGVSATVFAGNEHAHMRRSAQRAKAVLRTLHAGTVLTGQSAWATVSLGLVRSWHRLESGREIVTRRLQQWLESRYRLKAWQVFGELASPYINVPALGMNAPDTGVQGFARLAWVSLSSPAYKEHGGSAALAYANARTSTVFSQLGVRARHDWPGRYGNYHVQGELAWHHAAGERYATRQTRFAQADTPRSFYAQGQPVSRNGLDMLLSAGLARGQRAHAALSYTGRVASKHSDHGVRLDARWVF